MPETAQDQRAQQAPPYETPENPLLQQDWARVARGYEDEMRSAYERGDYKTAGMWRDCADVAWREHEAQTLELP